VWAFCAACAACGGHATSERIVCGTGTHDDGVGFCVSDLACGPGTYLATGECLPLPVGAGGGGADAAAGGPDARASDGSAGKTDGAAAGWDASANVDGDAPSFAIDPAHDNAQPGEAVATPLAPAWTASFGGKVSYPIVAGGRVFVSSSGTQPAVEALDVATGDVDWGPIAYGATVMLAYDGGRLFVLDGSGNLAALDAASGSRQWSTQLTGQIDFWSPPVAAGGLVYVNGLESGGTTYAVDEGSGKTVWTADTFDGSDGTVAVSQGVVYEAEACDQLSAFDAVTGHLDWYHSTSCTGGGGSAPAVYQGLIWVRDWALANVIIDSSGNGAGSFAASVGPSFHGGTAFYVNGGLTAVDVATGTIRWTFAGDGNLCTSAVIAGAGGQVFVASSAGGVYEVDESTGTQVSVDTSATPSCGSETEAMALAEGHLFVPSGNSLVVY
jgi:outer membrane protein assembly factor BamB